MVMIHWRSLYNILCLRTVAWVHGQNLEASDEVGAGRSSLSLQRVVEAWVLSGKQALLYQPLGDGTAERLDPLKALVKLPFALESPLVQQFVPLVYSSSAMYPQSVRSLPCRSALILPTAVLIPAAAAAVSNREVTYSTAMSRGILAFQGSARSVAVRI